MLTGRDPGELGVYGFRNRRSTAYGDLVYASSHHVRFPRVWDYVGAAGGRSIVVGVPQTAPPIPIEGELVAGFDLDGAAIKAGTPFTYPRELEKEVEQVVGDYTFDVADFRSVPRETVLEQVYAMTEQRFTLMAHLLSTRPWEFAMLCEIGPDRIHHCFWSDHDPHHPRHDPTSPHRDTVRAYYRFVDTLIARLLDGVGPDTNVLVVSDHGARAMQGGVCVNEVLRDAGWLILRREPTSPTTLVPDLVDWSRTRAWAEGGYYARVFLNVEGREPCGVVPANRKNDSRIELARLFECLALDDRLTLQSQVVWPERAYRRVRGLAPDLLVFFGDLAWRSLGTVGHGRRWLAGNDTGVDEANHAMDGLFILAGPNISRVGWERASILDVTPTILALMGLPVPDDLAGTSLLVTANVDGSVPARSR
jgi:predicted AlkP superfamily phosphohydrolase/phosphomutase